ncbi:PHA/PHB synthase family protein [Nakamurella deserti]|uniref:PHA/PHB synthase family protein n=1 Tax=Nakamurella deserti TaxID=2164074 RepID=UPI00197C8CCA|nr:alpha/beta fold hydrolase [Nakamurella deserti]
MPTDPLEMTRELAERAAAVLAPETDLFEDSDAAGLRAALTSALRAAALHPVGPARAALSLGSRLARIPLTATRRFLGQDAQPPVAVDARDRRFAAVAWDANPAFYALRLAYLAGAEFARDVVTGADIDADDARKARIMVDLLIDALAPTNFLATNPAALIRAFETGGASVVQGTRTFLDDLVHHGGRPRQVDTSGFTVGGNLACTPGRVVHRNALMELIQYAPQTDEVQAVPLLCSPPWINKYYIMDLAPQRSFIEWAVRHGRTVFAISYRNSSREMAATTMDDYLVHGPQAALDVVCEITGAATVDIVGLCLGGAMTAVTAAWLAGAGDSRVGTLTLLNTMLDYREPGALKAFTDQRTVERLEKKMARTGVLEGESMAGTFDVLRANDLIFNYVVSNWLMGQQPPAFDILAWNADSTRMPAAMHAFYLRHFYVRNDLARGTLELAGRRIDLSAITVPTYVVSAINDHIVPWEAAYETVNLVSGPVRFVLGNGGHIAGIVSPPGPKAWHEVVDPDAELPGTPGEWRAAATRREGSWWEDWTEWGRASAGPSVPPPQLGSAAHPPSGDAPGTYVHT